MGVAIAIPMSDYDVLQVDITTVSDTKRMPKKKKSEGVVAIVLSWIKESALRALKALGVWRPEPSHWKLALDRFNQLVSVRLQAKATGSKPFLLGTYHMPCMFKIPQVMSIHTALSAQHVKRLANGDPYVFVGDFNIKPGSTMYRLLTEGAVEPDVRRAARSYT
jgi:endonuclease/exonuclease/phosphatase family metal-dependent hydrolase